ncbi:hypothetical protein BD626DRAFT_450108 [Schizophyllum amplum]|uniref:Uncharacterized protein n=1 Tax=Schizophyllum amplum TaxID=97359 RepID=A0A550CT43_9AGAR|nr:hypothetical protein BD626DRAFT_450108 [Auriculariopsis ampla]
MPNFAATGASVANSHPHAAFAPVNSNSVHSSKDTQAKRVRRRKPQDTETAPRIDNTPPTSIQPKKKLSAKKEDTPTLPRDFGIVGRATRAAIAAVERNGWQCALFGSMACGLYGNKRMPNDADLLVFVPPDSGITAEDIKRRILDVNPRNFFLKMPRDPTQPYRKLYYRDEYLSQDCKVDILVPGTLMLPLLTPPYITRIDGIPVVPFSVLLLQKLQGWDDHGREEQGFKRTKQQTDEGDLRRMMALSAARMLATAAPPWGDRVLFSADFLKLSRERVLAYCKKFPDRATGWETLGFVTKAPESVTTDAATNAATVFMGTLIIAE